MDGLGRAAGSGVPIDLGGEQIILPGLTLEDLGTIEQYILTKRPDPLQRVAKVIKDLPEAEARELILRAYDDGKRVKSVSTEEVVDFLDSVHGLAFSVWVALHKRYGDRFSQKHIYDVLQQLDEQQIEELKRARDMASGLDELGNSTGRATGRRRASSVAPGAACFATLAWPLRRLAGWCRAIRRRSSENGRSIN